MGYDAREAAGTFVFLQSLRETTRARVSVEFVGGRQRDSTNAFGAHERFSVPARCGFRGLALFVDGADMLLRADLAGLFEEADSYSAVQVVKHDYATRHPRKYIGVPEMEADNVDYPRKNWSSVMLFRCDHSACRRLTPEFLEGKSASYLHRFEWAADERVGELSPEWNWLADEYGYGREARLLHWTAGIPGFRQYRNAPHADEWRATMMRAVRGLQTHLVLDIETIKGLCAAEL